MRPRPLDDSAKPICSSFWLVKLQIGLALFLASLEIAATHLRFLALGRAVLTTLSRETQRYSDIGALYNKNGPKSRAKSCIFDVL